MKRKTKLFVALGAAATAVAGAAVYAGKLMSDLAIRREPPKGPAVSFDGGDPEVGESRVKTALAAVEGLETERVEMVSYDGLKLVADWLRCEEPKRVVIAMHGWRSAWQVDFGCQLAFLQKEGCAVLLPHQRAQGESEGAYMGFGTTERLDCVGWIYKAIEEYPDLPIYLYGISMGAATVMMTAGLTLPDNVKGIIADCGYTSPKAIWKHCISKVLPSGAADGVGLVSRGFAMQNAGVDGNISAKDALADNRLPILFIHGDDDQFVPIEMGYENFRAAGGDKEMLVVPGAGHAMAYHTDPEAYEAAVRRLFAK